MQREFRMINRWSIFIFCIVFYHLQGYANGKISVEMVDSLSHDQYMQGEWNALIETGKIAKKNGISFKYLSQRLGYAHFIQKNYYQSLQNYEQAWKFDSQDEITQWYLFYNATNLGRNSLARYYSKGFSKEDLQYYHQQTYRWIDAIDSEYSYKMVNSNVVHDAAYRRIGINSQIGRQLNLYQSVAFFNQNTDTTKTEQYEYYVLASWNPLPKTNLSLGYHYVLPEVNYVYVGISYPYTYPGHAFFGKLSQQIHRFDIAGSGAFYNSKRVNSQQVGLHASVNFAGNLPVGLHASYYRVFESGSNNANEEYHEQFNIFRQSCSLLLSNRLWLEGFIYEGKLNYFIDNNGLYIYNSLDYTKFRTGLSAFFYVNRPLTIYLNYTYDIKQMYSQESIYNQHSLTGGIVWKI